MLSVNGGSPKSSGLKSNNDLRTIVAPFFCWSVTWESGTITHCIPAETAAVTPFGASSKTRH